MASPWKLLVRPMSPRRQQRQEYGSTDNVKPGVIAIAIAIAIAQPTDTTADSGLNAADPPLVKPVPRDQSGAKSAAPDHSEETPNAAPGTTDIEGARSVEAAHPALSEGTGMVLRGARKRSTTDENEGETANALIKIAEPFALCADMYQQQAAGFLSVSGKDCIYDGAPFREGGQPAVTDAQLRDALPASRLSMSF